MTSFHQIICEYYAKCLFCAELQCLEAIKLRLQFPNIIQKMILGAPVEGAIRFLSICFNNYENLLRRKMGNKEENEEVLSLVLCKMMHMIKSGCGCSFKKFCLSPSREIERGERGRDGVLKHFFPLSPLRIFKAGW